MTASEIKKQDAQNVMQTYARYDVVIERGEGATLYDPDGKKYIDFTGGIGVNSIGYGNKKWADAIYEQAMKLQHISNLFLSEPYVRLAKTLTKRAGMENVFFANAGGEANEGLIKLARKYSFDKYGKGRSTIISLVQSFHGRTITTLAATGQEAFHNYFFPFTEGFLHIPAHDINALNAALTDDVCALLIELIQGEGGVIPLQKEYVAEIAKICKEKDILLLVDEVQTGVGRTGSLFAFSQYGIEPDAVTFAKGIAGGLPMGGIMANEKCSKVLTAGTHATTFGGNPVAAAGAIEVLNQLDDAALCEVTKKGEYIKGKIIGWNDPLVGEIRGLGLMLGISIREREGWPKPSAIAKKCVENGLLILTAGSDAVRMLPPLTITYDEIDKGLEILKAVLDSFK
ncbi:MAG: aspartate aminotransferase family protein [Oscillospiraceae bacterium]|nr:aspartate aminotransferase family protein [Oscillospiraceae bacterium]